MLEDKSKNVDAQKQEAEEESAPAVVGQLSVSNDLLDFSSVASKREAKKRECAISGDCEGLTPREKAILARKKK